MVNNIKTFEERLKELVEEGKKQGYYINADYVQSS